MKKLNLKLLTFYAFVDIPDIQNHIKEHLEYTHDIGIKGRIYIWEEGISATLTGNPWQISAYLLYLNSKSFYQNIPDIAIKSTKVDQYYFDRMIVKYRKEIVALEYPVSPKDVATFRQEASIEQVKHIIDNWEHVWSFRLWVVWKEITIHGKPSEHVVLLDMRNSYEYKLGHYKYAIPSWTVNFREMHKLLEDYKIRFAGKYVIMYCTGGIRCEKLAVMLHKHWLDNFYSIDGGIVKYVNSFNDGNWLGNLYTFDGRVSTHVGDSKTHSAIGKCIYTDNLTDHIENCRYSPCNARIICKPSEYRKHLWFCSKECSERALHNFRVKNAKFDKWDYQRIRDGIEEVKKNQWEDAKEAERKEYQQIVWNFYSSRLSDIGRKHLSSQKEEYIDCEC